MATNHHREAARYRREAEQAEQLARDCQFPKVQAVYERSARRFRDLADQCDRRAAARPPASSLADPVVSAALDIQSRIQRAVEAAGDDPALREAGDDLCRLAFTLARDGRPGPGRRDALLYAAAQDAMARFRSAWCGATHPAIAAR